MRLTDERKELLAHRIDALIEAGKNEKAELLPRWKQNRDYYENVPFNFVGNFIEGATDYPYPFLKPRLDTLRDMVVGTICSQKPFMLAGVRGQNKRQEDIENTLQFFFEMGRLEDNLLRVSPIAGYTNTGIIRAQFHSSVRDFLPAQKAGVQASKTSALSFSGLTFDVIHPDDFICVGSNIFDIPTAQAVGHRYFLQRRQIEEMQKAKILLDADLTSGTPEENYSDRSGVNAETSYKGDDKVECWELIFRCSVKDLEEDTVKDYEKWYLVQFALDTKQLLKFEEYEGSRPWYAPFRFSPAPHDGFWGGGSIAQDLQGLHVQYQVLNNIIPYGAIINAFPTLFVKDAPFEKSRAWTPGQMVALQGGEIQNPQLKFDPGAMFNAITQIERNGDISTRINSAGMGQEYSKDMTATEAAQLASGQQTGVSGFIRIFGQGLIDLCDICCELLYNNFDLWYPQYGKDIYGDTGFEPTDLLLPISWDVNGKSPSQTPQQTAAKMQALLELSTAEQQAGVQDVLGQIVPVVSQVMLAAAATNPALADPKLIQQVAEMVAGQLASSPSSPMLDRREIIRTFVNNLGINNADKVLVEANGQSGSVDGDASANAGVGDAAQILSAQSGLPAQQAQGDGISPGY